MVEPGFEPRQSVSRAPAVNPELYGSEGVPALKEFRVREEKDT